VENRPATNIRQNDYVIGVPGRQMGEAVKAIVVKKAEVAPEALRLARERIAGFSPWTSSTCCRQPERQDPGRRICVMWWAGRERKVN
jgi:acyl-CoA synthetase (AMP-forming)/AMP-acid ligase II